MNHHAAVDAAIIAQAALRLRAGGLVAFPTETVYGLGALATREDAVRHIFRAKGRPPTHPLVLHVDNIEMAKQVVAHWPAEAEALARAFWPGPLTMVLPKAEHVSTLVTGGRETVAVRMPASNIALALIRQAGGAVAAPSANPYQGISPTTAEHVQRGLGAEVDLIVDGGPCARGLESTIVDVVHQSLLRLGPVSPSALRQYLPGLQVAEELRHASDEHAHIAPGMDAKHYAPKARLRLRTRADIESAPEEDGVVALSYSFEPRIGLRLPADADGYGTLLFAALHSLDREDVREILAERVPANEQWLAIADRLQRASFQG